MKQESPCFSCGERQSFNDIKLADITLNDNPINNTDGSLLNLTAKVDNVASAYNGKVYSLIYGSGGTSHSRIRIKTDGGVEDFNLNGSNSTDPVYDAATKTVSRDFHIVDATKGIDITLTQKVGTSSGTDSKAYELSYSVKNNSTSEATIDFLFNADTAYNNDDSQDNYYVNGNLLNKFTVFSNNGASKIGDVATNANVTSPIPDSLSLVDKGMSLPFTEYFSWAGSKPNVVCMGNYFDIGKWELATLCSR